LQEQLASNTLDENNISIYCFDCLKLGDDLTEQTLSERKHRLHSLNFSQHILEAPYIIVDNKENSIKAIKLFKNLPGSDGVFIKDYNSYYNKNGKGNIVINNIDSEEIESLCLQCGLCCHEKVKLSSGDVIINPTKKCKFLGEDKLCTIYESRFQLNPGCLNFKQMIAKDYILPDSCPYTKLRSDYVPAIVVTKEEFDELMSEEGLTTLGTTGMDKIAGKDNGEPVSSQDDQSDEDIQFGYWDKEMSEKKYTPPDSAKNNAQKVLDWKKKYGKEVNGMTAVGWLRARQLASGKPISLNIVQRMAQFNRHRKNSKIDPKYKNTPWKDAGYVAWLGWGGTTGIDWAINISKSKNNNDTTTITPGIDTIQGKQIKKKPKKKQ